MAKASVPQNLAAGNPNFDGNPPVPTPPGTDMTSICFRDQLWLNTYPLDRNLVFDYFALSPFYDWTCNNEQLRMNSIHPLDMTQLSKMTGIEYVLSEVMEPNLFVIRKQKRDSPEKVTPMLTYYALDGSIYQAPQLCNVFASRIVGTLFLALASYYHHHHHQHHHNGRSLYYISKAFSTAASKLEKVGYVEGESEGAAADLKTSKETIDLKEVKRVDYILASLQRKLGPAPPPPPFPEGYNPPQPPETENGSEEQQQGTEPQLSAVDPIIDQGPSKRLRLE